MNLPNTHLPAYPPSAQARASTALPLPHSLADIMSRAIAQIGSAAPLSEAAQRMTEASISSVVVTEAGKPVGILTEQDMLRLFSAGTSTATPVAEVMSGPVATAHTSDTFTGVWLRMCSLGLRHLVVVDAQGVAVGLVSESDFRNHMDGPMLTRMGGLTDLMERELPELPPDASLQDALHLMLRHRSTYVVITRQQRALGILTERDIPRLMAHTASGTDLSHQPLITLAHTPLHTVSADTWMVEAAAQMQRLKVRHLAVVNAEGLLVGMVQLHRIMVRLGEQLQHQHTELEKVRLQQRTEMAEGRLVMAARAARMGFWDLDLATGNMHLSGHTTELVGMPLPGGQGSLAEFMGLVEPADREKLLGAMRRGLDSGQPAQVNVEYRIRRPDGALRWFHTVGRTVETPDGTAPSRAMGVTTDITERKQQRAQLEQLSRTLERSPVVAMIWIPTGAWPVEYVSPNVRQWGYEPADFANGKLPYEDIIHPDDLPRINAEIASHLAQGRDHYDQTYRIRTASGQWLWMEDRTWVERDASGQPHRYHGMLSDISARLWLEHMADAERHMLEQLAQGQPLPILLHALAQGYEELMPGMQCSVLLLNEQTQTLHLGAAPSLPAAYSQAIEGLQIGPNVGSCGTAAFTGQTVVVSNIGTDPRWVNFRPLAAAHQLKACWSVPVKSSRGKVLGTFAMYPAQPVAPTQRERQSIERGAYLASLAIERDQTQQTLHKLSMAVEQSPNSIVITNLKAEIEYANQAFFTITGYTPEEVMGCNPRILQSGKTPASTYAHMWAQLRAGQSWKGEFINHRKDGSEYTESVRISPVQQPDGHVTHYLAIKEDITRQKQAEQQIYKLAYFDVLTGLPNRQLLADRFQQAVNLVKRQKMPLALMFIDLDHFKNINDTLGHSAGDDLLIQVARRLESLVRAGDTLSRQGGDEFVLVLPGCGSEEAAAVACKLVQQHNRSITLGAQEVVVTLSIGISVFPTDGSDFETLSKSADMAMYQAKLAGRNTWRQFKPDMQARSSRTLMLENSLRQAQDKGQLELVYQPQVSLANGELLGLEALLRWRHPDLGMVSPAEFIPLAETSGQILRMGEWVMHTAARQLKTWLDQGMPPVTMAVNLSAIQFRDPGLVATVARVLHETGLPPTCLELELTESIAMSDPLGAVATIDELHAMQVTMSIDDFGTGYSSLSYLKRFKVSKLKIDQSFVRDITTDPEDKAIVSAIIGLASNLGLRTIAEGVETPGQLAWLRLQGCDEAQGYFFSTPLTPLEFPTWMARHQPGSAPAQPTAT